MDGKQIRIYGDNFDADTRSLLAFCEMAGIEAHYENCDIFDQSRKTEFESRNPTGSIPFIEEKDSLVLSDGFQNFHYMLTRFSKMEQLGSTPATEKEFTAI